ncbi:MAG TPA: hypothetical protein VGV89_03220 [Thermoplasmata archaeon]|nr:hypothetical protein [Thermoplasmata archaeon]
MARPGVADVPDEVVLPLLDELERALIGWRHGRAGPGPSDGAPPEIPPPPAEILPEPTAGARVSPYLEERLARARRDAARLQAGARELAGWVQVVGVLSDSMATELGRAVDELAYARERGLIGDGGGTADPPFGTRHVRAGTDSGRTGGSWAVASSAAPAEVEEEAPGADRYRRFTVAEYNRSIGGLKRRWPTVAVLAVVVGAVISAILVAIAFLSHAPEPPVWVAVLPAVWAIPVPFFALAFRGTRRILRRNHLELEPAP